MPALREKDFNYGEPVPLAFAAPLEPREVASKFGGPQMMFGSTAGAIYLDAEAARAIAEAIRAQGIQPGEPCRLTRTKTPHGGSRFTVERDRYAAPPPPTNGNGHHAGYNAPPASAPPTPSEPLSGSVQAISARMMSCFMAAIDAVGEAQAFATKRGLGITFTSDNITSAALSCYINECKGGRS